MVKVWLNEAREVCRSLQPRGLNQGKPQGFKATHRAASDASRKIKHEMVQVIWRKAQDPDCNEMGS